MNLGELPTALVLEAGYQYDRATCPRLTRRQWWTVRIQQPTDMVRLGIRFLDMLAPYLRRPPATDAGDS